MLPSVLSNFRDLETQRVADELFHDFKNKYGEKNIGKCIALTLKTLNQKGYPMDRVVLPEQPKTLPVEVFTQPQLQNKKEEARLEDEPKHQSLFGDLKYF